MNLRSKIFCRDTSNFLCLTLGTSRLFLVLSLIGFDKAPWRDRLAITFLGIRGIGSLYYLAYAMNEETFEGEDEIWTLVALVIVISIFVHGITATPITSKLDKMREEGS